MTTRLERRLKTEGVTLKAFTEARTVYETAKLTLGIGYASGRFAGWRIEGFISEPGGALWLNHWVPLARAVSEPQRCIDEWHAKAQEELRRDQ